jgi:hypothetical protein
MIALRKIRKRSTKIHENSRTPCRVSSWSVFDLRSQISDLRSRISDLRSRISDLRFSNLRSPISGLRVYDLRAKVYDTPVMQAQSPIAAWETFFFLVGSSGAALTGLQFVVIALVAESRRRATPGEIDAFATPTIVHFCAVLLISALMNAPWQGLSLVALAIGACGLAGIVYVFIVLRRARHQPHYSPVFEDWLWHFILPLSAYTLLLISAIELPSHPRPVLFVFGGSALLLLFVGIHNAWDTVTYITIELPSAPDELNGPEEENDPPTDTK